MKDEPPVSIERIERAIHLFRGHKVMLDEDLAALYQVETKALVQAVKRNPSRFPKDFAFQITPQEFTILRSQIVTSRSDRWGGRRYPPLAFTEQGVAMLSSVLRSRRAVEVNVEIMRTFVRLRHLIASDPEFARKVAELESTTKRHEVYLKAVFEAIRKLMVAERTAKAVKPEAQPSRPIGFLPPKK